MVNRISRDPRQRRLKIERERLERLNQKSDHVRVQPINVQPGSEPEKYRVTFLCRGIAGIDSQKNPIYSNRHQVDLYCDEEFPADIPRLQWVTPIWHPDIQHREPKGIWINRAQWLGGMGLEDLCREMFEMVQYKIYHAAFAPPYPLDPEVARWVIEFAEPRGIVDKRRGIFIDDKPFTRPTAHSRIYLVGPSSLQPYGFWGVPVVGPAAPARIKLLSTKPVAPKAHIRGNRVTIVKKD